MRFLYLCHWSILILANVWALAAIVLANVWALAAIGTLWSQIGRGQTGHPWDLPIAFVLGSIILLAVAFIILCFFRPTWLVRPGRWHHFVPAALLANVAPLGFIWLVLMGLRLSPSQSMLSPEWFSLLMAGIVPYGLVGGAITLGVIAQRQAEKRRAEGGMAASRSSGPFAAVLRRIYGLMLKATFLLGIAALGVAAYALWLEQIGEPDVRPLIVLMIPSALMLMPFAAQANRKAWMFDPFAPRHIAPIVILGTAAPVVHAIVLMIGASALPELPLLHRLGLNVVSLTQLLYKGPMVTVGLALLIANARAGKTPPAQKPSSSAPVNMPATTDYAAMRKARMQTT